MSRVTLRVAAASAAAGLTLAGWLASFPSALQDPQAQRRPVFRAGAVFVIVDVYPQQNGRVVEGLTVKDFQVFEDGQAQTIESLEFVRVEPNAPETARRDPNNQREMADLAADPLNRVFVVYLDKYHVTIAGSHAIRRPLIDTLNRIVTPDDLFGVLPSDIPARFLVLGRRMLTVEDQLTRHWPWGERYRLTDNPDDAAPGFMRACFGESGLGVELMNRYHEDQTLSRLEELIAYLGAMREARSVAIVVTDGWRLYRPDTGLAEMASQASRGEPPAVGHIGDRVVVGRGLHQCVVEAARLAAVDNQRRFRDIVTLANRNNVSFYPVTPAGLAVFDTPIGVTQRSIRDRQDAASDMARVTERVEGLKALAHNTDGIAVVDTNDLGAGLRRIADDVSAYYVLGYYSTNTKHDGRYRRIEVKTRRPNLTIKARRGFVAPAAPVAPSETNARSAPPVRKVSALPEDAFGLLARLRPGAEMFSYAAVEAGAVQVAVELPRGKAGSTVRNVRVSVHGADGIAIDTVAGTINPPVRSAIVRVPLPAGSTGPWKVSVSVDGVAEPVSEQIAARPERLIGDPLVFRATSSPRSPLWPVADFQFTRTERVHVEWRLRGELDRRTARLLGRDGNPIAVPVTATEREQDGVRILAVDLQLAPLTAGDYVIEIVAGAGKDSDTRLVPIRITG